MCMSVNPLYGKWLLMLWVYVRFKFQKNMTLHRDQDHQNFSYCNKTCQLILFFWHFISVLLLVPQLENPVCNVPQKELALGCVLPLLWPNHRNHQPNPNRKSIESCWRWVGGMCSLCSSQCAPGFPWCFELGTQIDDGLGCACHEKGHGNTLWPLVAMATWWRQLREWGSR